MGRELLSLPLFKEETQQLKKGERLGRKTLSLPLFNADENSMLMGNLRGRAWTDETCSDRQDIA